MSRTPIDDRIRLELGARSSSRDEMDRFWNQIEGAIADGSQRSHRRSRVRHSRGLALALVLLLSLGGIAVAAETNLVERVFGDDDPVVERVDQFNDEATDRATAAEYKQLQSMTMVPGVKRVGIIRDDEMVQQYKLAPIDRSRVVVDDPSVGRVVAVPTVDGSTICQLYAHPDGLGSGGGCGIQFDRLGLSPTWSMKTAEEPFEADAIWGLASDDVDRIAVEFADGTREDVNLVKNAFLWRASSDDGAQIAIHTWRGARHERLTNKCWMQPKNPTCE